ncbi:MAG: zinc ABC transporter substrate-binding protein [Propionibacteriaceae bacterium]|nr:zinc ABC transporter substrate-binding protein [Propionibacteriaceae bacterium]
MVLMTIKPRFALLTAAVVASALTGCAPGTATGTTEQPNAVTVTVAAYPLQFLAERIVGDAGVVTNLTAPGTEPHDLELTARQIAAMAATDAVVYIPGFQAAVDDAIASTPPKLAIDVTSGLSLLKASQDGAEEGADAGSSYDPHIWLSPANMVTMAHTISTALSTEKPQLAGTFDANTKALVADLTALGDSYRTGLASCQRTQFITSHAAFGYLARDYGLQQIPIAGLDPTQEPTAARIAAVHQLARQYGVTTIFFETLVSDTVAKSIAGDLGLKTAVLDPIEGITPSSAGTDYLEVMRSNLTALEAANGCS